MKEEKKAVLITFSIRTKNFDSNTERNKFFNTLYGWNQTVTKDVKGKIQKKVYEYRREGLLDDIPHEKVGQSSFIVPENEFDKVEKFFEEWHNKVMWRTFKVLNGSESIFDNFRKKVMEDV